MVFRHDLWAAVCLALALVEMRCAPPGGGSGAVSPDAIAPDTISRAAMPRTAMPRDTISRDTVRERASPAQPSPPRGAAPMRTLPASAHLFTAASSSLGEPEARVLRDQPSWEAAWRGLQAGLAAGPAPAVDFTRDMVVLVALGQRSSGGHAVRAEGVSDAPGGGLVVHVVRTAPGPGCMAPMVITSPVDVVRVPRVSGPVRVEARDVSTSC